MDIAGPRPEARGKRTYSEEDARMAPMSRPQCPAVMAGGQPPSGRAGGLGAGAPGAGGPGANHHRWNQSCWPANLGQNFTPESVQVVRVKAASHEGRDRCQWWPDQILSCFLIIYKNDQLVIQSSAKKMAINSSANFLLIRVVSQP